MPLASVRDRDALFALYTYISLSLSLSRNICVFVFVSKEANILLPNSACKLGLCASIVRLDRVLGQRVRGFGSDRASRPRVPTTSDASRPAVCASLGGIVLV